MFFDCRSQAACVHFVSNHCWDCLCQLWQSASVPSLLMKSGCSLCSVLHLLLLILSPQLNLPVPLQLYQTSVDRGFYDDGFACYSEHKLSFWGSHLHCAPALSTYNSSPFSIVSVSLLYHICYIHQ